MFATTFAKLEKNFFRTLNQYVEPVIRAGVGSPGLVPVGVVVLETKGRKSGRIYKTPLVASGLADLLIVSTIRPNSQWVKNLAVTPQTTVWLRGQARRVNAYLIDETASANLPTPSPLVKLLLNQLSPLGNRTGVTFAVLDMRV